MNTESIIGRKYYPPDNSYAVCLTDGSKNYSLGGNHLPPKPKQKEECIIMSDPFDMVVHLWNDRYETKTMVLVKCPRGYTHSVLFYEAGFENREMDAMYFRHQPIFI